MCVRQWLASSLAIYLLSASVVSAQFHDDSCGMADACSPVDLAYDSLLRASADAVWLTSDSGGFVSEVLDPNTNLVSNSQVLDTGFEISPRAKISGPLRGFRAEFIYFGIDQWDATGNLVGQAAAPSLSGTVDYSAFLRSFELNVHGEDEFTRTTTFVGIRSLQYGDAFRESFQLNTGAGVVSEIAAGNAENDLLGLQAGYGIELGEGPTIAATAKVGVFNNHAVQTGPSYTNAIVIDGVAEPQFTTSDDSVVWLGEFEVVGKWYVRDNLVIRLGYQGLLLSDLIESARQNGAQATGNQVGFHGGIVGIEWFR